MFTGELERTFLVLREVVAQRRAKPQVEPVVDMNALPEFEPEDDVFPGLAEANAGNDAENGRGLKRVPSGELAGTPSKRR